MTLGVEWLKLTGRVKKYDITETTFGKREMWPESYTSEIRGLNIARAHGISVPKIISHNLDANGGNITFERLRNKRLDQVLWNNPNPQLLKSFGSLLADIHTVSDSTSPDVSVIKHRFLALQKEASALSVLPEESIKAASSLMEHVISQLATYGPYSYIHGDYTMQNIFHGSPPIVYDWERSTQGPSYYDLGCFLSYMILLVTEGGWTYEQYQAAKNTFIEGYKQKRLIPHEALNLIKALDFLGHRRVEQYYLFVMERLAVVGSVSQMMQILKGEFSISDSIRCLEQAGIKMDPVLGIKLLESLRRHDYPISEDFWLWVEKG